MILASIVTSAQDNPEPTNPEDFLKKQQNCVNVFKVVHFLSQTQYIDFILKPLILLELSFVLGDKHGSIWILLQAAIRID